MLAVTFLCLHASPVGVDRVAGNDVGNETPATAAKSGPPSATRADKAQVSNAARSYVALLTCGFGV